MAPPRTQYAHSGDINIAYQVVGEGPLDILLVPGWLSQVEHMWEEPSVERLFNRLASFGRLIAFDRRGCGLSDRLSEPPTLEEEVQDVVAVLDAAGSERAALIGYAAGGTLAVWLATSLPERVVALVLYAAMIRHTAAPDYAWALTTEQRELSMAESAAHWGEGANVGLVAPSRANDLRFVEWMGRLERLAVSPGTMIAMVRKSAEADVRDRLPAIRVPTLVLHRTGDPLIDVRHSRFAAGEIPGARYVELEGSDHLMTVGDTDAIVDETEEFLTGGRRGVAPERALLTVMFSDIVDATKRAASLGDGRWRELLANHDAIVRKELRRFGGHEVKTIGDSFLVTFDVAPSHAVRCAREIVGAVHEAGLEVRVGMHTGECEIIGDDVGGMAVHIAARVIALAQAGEILVSGTTCGTVTGAGIGFEHRGMHSLKGVPGDWPLFAVIP
jgi:pimeloyl-ACP methyl ester carboxylesterase